MSNEDNGEGGSAKPWVILAVVLLFLAVISLLFVVIARQKKQLQQALNNPPVVAVGTSTNQVLNALTKTNDATFGLHVLDSESGGPIGGVRVLVQSFIRNPWSIRTVAKKMTDPSGQLSVPIPTSPGLGLRVCVAIEGYDSTLLMWEPDTIPQSYEVKLSKCLTVTATVVDESGQIVTNALVLPAKGFPVGKSRLQGVVEQTGFGDEFLQKRTDQHGKWVCEFLPRDLKEFTIRVTRPGQPETLFQVSDSTASPGPHHIRYSDLIAGTAKLTISNKP